VRRAELHLVVAARLRALNQRYTSTRRALIDMLADADAPITTSAMRDRDRDLALSSIYRNLTLLEQAGVVCRVVGSAEHASFELAEEFTEHHHHLLCTRCGSVSDFTIGEDLERGLDQALRRVAKRNRFDATAHRLDIVGVCSSCR
jgi:Fe2+ or Zn2+ uptake regulation protein